MVEGLPVRCRSEMRPSVFDLRKVLPGLQETASEESPSLSLDLEPLASYFVSGATDTSSAPLNLGPLLERSDDRTTRLVFFPQPPLASEMLSERFGLRGTFSFSGEVPPSE